MKQVLQSYRTGELRIADVPVPQCLSGGVLVRTRYSVISAGTERMLAELAKKNLVAKARARPDLVRRTMEKARSEGIKPTVEQVFAKLDEPVALGYSAAGDVIEAGHDAGGLKPGDRIAAAGGGYATHAEFNFVPRNLCVRIPEGVSRADAAFTTLGAIALQGVRQADPLLGERVVVVGLGLLGLLTVQILKANGCAVLGADLNPARARLAEELGADAVATTDVREAGEAFTNGRGADAVIIAAATSGNGPIETAADLSRQKGRVVAVGSIGLNVPRDAFYKKELDLRLSMSYGPGRHDVDYEEGGADYPFPYVRFTEQRNMESFLYLVQQGRVNPGALATHTIDFENALDGYALLDEPVAQGSEASSTGPLGILLKYGKDATPAASVCLAGEEGGRRSPATGAADHGRRAAGRQASDGRGRGMAKVASRTDGMGRVGVGFVGAGDFARRVLLPRLAKMKHATLTSVCTVTGRSARQAGERFGFATATTDMDAVLQDPDTHAVFVATRHDSHASLAAAALRAGKHVFVEKPLGVREAELEEVASALEDARAAGFQPCLMVGFNRRFSPHAAVLRAAFGHGRTPLAVSYRVNAGRVPADHWVHDPTVGGGRLIGEGCHFVDFCNALIASEPVAVTAAALSEDRPGNLLPDSVAMTVEYADGSLAAIQYLAGGHREMPKERCEVFSGGRSAVISDFRSTTIHGGGRGLRGKQDKGFDGELRAFLDACREGGAWPIPWDQIVAAHRVCFGAMRSVRTGERVRLGGGSPQG